MNKKLAVVLAALMMLSSTTFLAASPDNDLKVNYVAQDGTVIEFTVTEASKEVEAEAETVVAEKVVSSDDVVAEILDTQEVSLPASMVAMPEGGLDLELICPAVKAGDNIVILHKAATGWELIAPISVANGKVVAHFDSLSPVSIVKVTEADAAAPAVNPYYTMNPYGAAKLPKTGAVVVLPVAAMACLAGAVACGRKEK